jgi:hypothetical protein
MAAPPASEGFGEASPASGEAEVDPEEPVVVPDPVDDPEPFVAPEPPDKPESVSPLGIAEASDDPVPVEEPDVALEPLAPLLGAVVDVAGGLVPHAARAAAVTRFGA